MPGVPLRTFAAACDAAAGTSSKLRKQSILASFLKPLDAADLPLAVRYAAGRPFPASDERVLGVSGALITDVLVPLSGLPPHDFYDLTVRSGEIGEALAQIWPARADGTEPPLTLQDLATGFDELAATGNQEAKRAVLRRLFTQCRTPREAAYLAKILFRDMRTGVQEGVLQAAVAEAFGKALKEIQSAQLLLGDLGTVALLAKDDALHTAKFTLFHPIQFMLATPQDTADIAAKTINGRTFLAEDKLDGIRAQVHKSAHRIAIYTRTMDRTDESFPDVVETLEKIPGDFLLDGELVPYQHGQVLPFAHIQRRLGRKIFTPKVLSENPAAFIAFDLLYLNGELLMDRPLHERKALLKTLPVLTTEAREVTTAAQIEAAFAAARARRNEGIVLKDPDSPYAPGRRGQLWLKLKTHLPTLDCVVTAAEYGHGKRKAVLSDYTFAVRNGDQLLNIGKAYTGLTDEEIATLTELFLKLSITQHGRVHVVQPQVVLEIACDSIQRSTRHASGYAFRFPRIKRIRWDKRPQDADTLDRVKEIYESPPNFARSAHPIAKPIKPPEPSLFDNL